MSAKPSRTISSIDRSERIFESHAGGKTKKNKTFFVNLGLNQIQNISAQMKKMKDGIFSFQL